MRITTRQKCIGYIRTVEKFGTDGDDKQVKVDTLFKNTLLKSILQILNCCLFVCLSVAKEAEMECWIQIRICKNVCTYLFILVLITKVNKIHKT